MVRLDEIRKEYPPELHRYADFLVREYLQHKILAIVYDSPFARKLFLIGGTCLRILHGNQRFSEDLDFDFWNLTEEEFGELSSLIERELTLLGYEVGMKRVMKNAWHCHIRFPGLLHDLRLTGHKEQTILIQLDAASQAYFYYAEPVILNRFEVFTEVIACPVEIIFAQKVHAILERVRNKGRDFYDLSVLMGRQVKPDFEYLRNKTGIGDLTELKSALLAHCEKLDMEAQAKDVEPFVFRMQDARRVSRFVDTLQAWKP